MGCALDGSVALSFWFASLDMGLQPCEWVRGVGSSVFLACCAWGRPFTLLGGGREPSALSCTHLEFSLRHREQAMLAACPFCRYHDIWHGTEGTGSPVCLATPSLVFLMLSRRDKRGSKSWLKCYEFSVFLPRFSRFLNKCFFICYMSLGQFQEILNSSIFKLFTNYICFGGE